jgi:lysophospholipase L1-like esterase
MKLPALTLFLASVLSSLAAEPSRHEQKVAAARAHAYDLIFIGDSITQNLEKPEFKSVWDKYCAPRNAFNLGYSGYRTENILDNLKGGELDNQNAKLVVLLIGTNNSDDANYPRVDSPEQIAEGTKKIVLFIQEKMPDCKILLLRIFPRWRIYKNADGTERGSAEKRFAVNERAGELVSQLADNEKVFFLDINPVFLKKDGKIDPELMPDLLHPSPKGARKWMEAMEPTVAKLFGDTPRN